MEWISDNSVWVIPTIVFGLYYAALAILRAVAPKTENTWDDKALSYLESLDTEQLKAWVVKLNQEITKRSQKTK